MINNGAEESVLTMHANQYEMSAIPPIYLKNGPNKNRSCTNLFCCFLFLCSVSGLGYSYFITYQQSGDITKLEAPSAADGQLCGISNLIEYPLLYFVTPESEYLYRTVCVKQCPTKQSDKLQCSPNKQVPDCTENVSPTDLSKQVLIYESTEFGNMCQPVNKIYQENIQSAMVIGTVEQALLNVNAAMPIIGASGGIAFGMCALLIILLGLITTCVTWVFLLVYIFFTGLLGVYFLALFMGQQTSWIPVPQIANTSYKLNIYILGVAATFGVLSLYALLQVCVNITRIKFMISLIKLATKFLYRNKSVLFVPILFFILIISALGGWLSASIFILTQNKRPQSDQQLPFDHLIPTMDTLIMLSISLAALLCIRQYLLSFSRFITVSTATIWYFMSQAKENYLIESFKLAIRYHNGSIVAEAFYSTLFGWLATIYNLIHGPLLRMKLKRHNPILHYSATCCLCLCCACEHFLMYINNYAFGQIVLTSENYIDSCKTVFFTIKRNEEDFNTLQGLGDSFTHFSKMFIFLLSTIISLIILAAQPGYHELIKYPMYPAIAMAFITLSIATLFMDMFGQSADALILSYFTDCEVEKFHFGREECGSCPTEIRETLLHIREKKKLLSEQSFGEIQEKVKTFIFGFFYVLQKDQKTNPLFIGILGVFQFVQLHSYMFRDEINYVWNDTALTDPISSFFTHILFSTYFSSVDTYLILLIIMMACLMLLLGMMFYLGYSYYAHSYINRNAAGLMKGLIHVLMTVLYIPIVEFQTFIWSCPTDVTSGNAQFFSLQCWSGTHIGYCILGVINLIMFKYIVIMSVFTVYECRTNTNDLTALRHGRSHMVLILFSIISELAFSIFKGASFKYILLGINFGGSLVIFISFTLDSPYIHLTFIRLHQITSSILIWSSFMICVATALEGNVVSGTLVAWLFGLPFVILLIMTQRDRQIEILVQNVNKLSSPEAIMTQVHYLLLLLNQQNQEKYAIMLDGYIEIHKQACDKADCPLRTKKGKNARLIKNVIDINLNVKNEKQSLLILTLHKMYEQGVEKFEKHVELRIRYAFFLLEIMRYKRKALQELQRAEECDPSLDVQFLLYRYKRIIESEIQDDSNDKQLSNHEILPISAAPPIIAGLAAEIEKSAFLHLEYWSELQDETPDIAKLEAFGKKVTDSIAEVEFLWKKLQRVSPNHQPSIILYAQFQMEILNDKEMAASLSQKVRQMIQNENQNSKIEDVDNHDYSYDSMATIVLASDNEKFGLMSQINSSAAALFGYSKNELQGAKIQQLMPKLFAKYHDQFIETFISSNEVKYQQKNRVVFGRNKGGYIFSINLHIRPVNSMRSGMAFVGTLAIDKVYKHSAVIIIDETGHLEGMSSQCISLLKIDMRIYLSRKYISEFFPQILNQREQYQTKQGAQIQYTYPREVLKLMATEDQENTTLQLQCTCQEIQFSTSFAPNGYAFKFEKTGDQTASQLNSSVLSKKSHNLMQPNQKQEKQNHGKFILSYNADIKSFDGNFKDVLNYSDIGSQQIDQSVISYSKSNNIFITPNSSDSQNKLLQQSNNINNNNQNLSGQVTQYEQYADANQRRWDDGMKIVRLFQNKISEIINDDEQIMEEEEQEYEGNQYQGVNQNMFYNENDEIQQQDQEQFQSRSKLEQLIDQNNTPFPIRFLRVTEAFLTVSLIALSFTDYFLDMSQQTHMQQAINTYNVQTNMIAEMQYILENIRDLQLIQLGVYGSQTANNVTLIISQMAASINYIQTQANDLILSSYPFPPALQDLYTQPTLVMFFNSTTSQTYDFQQANTQMLSYAMQIETMQKSLLNISLTTVEQYFTIVNGFNNFLTAQQKASSYTLADFTGMTADRSSNFIIIVVVSAVILVVTSAIIVIILLSVRYTKEFVIILFLELPNHIVKSLFFKCEQFVKMLSVMDGEGSQQGEEEMEQQGENEEQLLLTDNKKRKKKKFKNSAQPPYFFYIQIILLIIIIEAYFVLSLLLQKANLSDIRQVLDEGNQTIIAESVYALASNIQQAVFINSTFLIQNQMVSTYAAQNLETIYELDSAIHVSHSKNIGILEAVYNNAYDAIMFENPCVLLKTLSNNVSDCSTIAGGTVAQGFTVAVTRYFEDLRFVQGMYTQSLSNQSITNIDPSLTLYNITNNTIRNLQLNLIRTAKLQEVKDMQRRYFKVAIRYLGDQFINGLQAKQDSYKARKIGLFVAFLAIVILMYVLYWIPFHQHLDAEIWKTRMTLLMIPVENLIRLKNAKAYCKAMINKKN